MAVYEEKWYTDSTSVGPYTFTFPYLKEADVKVEKNGTLLTPTTEYTQGFTEITLASEPLSTDIIRIYRDTDKDFLSSTFYPGSAIRSSDLNDNFTQNLYSSQESAENARDAIRATDAFIATTSDEGDTWVTTGYGTTHGQDPNTDPKGIGYAVTTSEAADGKADAAVETADDAELLVHTYVADGNGNLKGDGISPNPQGVKYAVVTAEDAEDVADEARDTYAIPAKQATDALVGTTTDNGQTWTLRGDGISPNPQGVAYAVGKADDALANSRLADGATPASPSGGYTSAIYLADQADDNATDALDNSRISTGGTPAGPSGGYTSAIYLADQADTNATDAVSTANAAQANSRIADGATPAAPSGGYTSAIYLADAALDNSRKSDGATPPVYTSAIDVADAATVTAASAVATANTASANATAAQNAVTNAELFTPYATVSDIPSNNVSSITVTAGGSVYETVPAVTITNTTGATGSGATATAVLTNGVVTSITVNTKGNNYDNGATVAIAQSTGTGGTHATATAVLGPLNEDKAEIADSTGLESFTPLTGKPVGFILGDEGLTVKLKYNTSSTTWEWVNYYSNDPETRYRKKIIIENKRIIDEDYAVGVDNNGFSVGPVSIANNKILTIPNNSTYLVL